MILQPDMHIFEWVNLDSMIDKIKGLLKKPYLLLELGTQLSGLVESQICKRLAASFVGTLNSQVLIALA